MTEPRVHNLKVGRNERMAQAGLVLVIIILSAALLANSMLKPLSRDEHMYCSAGVLMAQGQAIYRDFSYPSQLPYHPLLLAVFYTTLGTTHYLLVGRMVSVACDIGVLILMAAIYRRIFSAYQLEGCLLASAAVLLYAFNPMVARAAGYAWNHDVVIFCVLLSFWFFITTDFQKRSDTWRLALMGALLMFATCMRVTTALVTALFMVALFVWTPGSFAKRTKTLLPFSLSALVVLAWPLWIFVHAPEAVRVNLFHIPTLYARWLHEIGMTFGKARLTLAALTSPAYLALFGMAGYLTVVTIKRRSDMILQNRRNRLLAVFLVGVFVIIAFIPPTMWEQYWAMPVSFWVIALAFPLALLCKRAETVKQNKAFRIGCWIMAVCAMMTIYDNTAFVSRTPKAWSPKQWVPVQVHQTSVEIAKHIPERGPVLTLGPLYALEGKRDIYPELANGSIVYRVAGMMSPDQREVTHTVGPETIKTLLQKSPLVGAILGVEDSPASLETPLLEAIPSNWRHITYDDLQVYFKP